MKGLRILIVDDEPLMRLSMVDALEAVGYDVQAAASGTEGIEAIRSREFDLVITDLKMPGIGGLDLIRHGRANLRDTAVIMITGYASIESAVAAVNWGTLAILEP